MNLSLLLENMVKSKNFLVLDYIYEITGVVRSGNHKMIRLQ